MDRLLGGSHATAIMSRTHAEIARQTRRLGQMIDDIGASPPDAADIADLRALLYGLHAILSLHTAQEDESYLSFGGNQAAPDAAPGIQGDQSRDLWPCSRGRRHAKLRVTLLKGGADGGTDLEGRRLHAVHGCDRPHLPGIP
jgi:hypothetical protein